MIVTIEKELSGPHDGPYYHVYRTDDEGNKELIKTIDGDIKEAARVAERAIDFEALQVAYEKSPDSFRSNIPLPDTYKSFAPKFENSVGEPCYCGRRGRQGGIPAGVSKMAEEYQSKLGQPYDYDKDDIISAYESGFMAALALLDMTDSAHEPFK